MTAATLTRPNTARPISRARKAIGKPIPAKPVKHLWEADKGRAFEAGVRWFLAVSRAA